MKRMVHAPSPAMVVALVALFAALGGGAYAALKLPKNSVGTAQLKKNAVTTVKIKNGAVTGAKVKNQSLTGADINLAGLGTVPDAAALQGHPASDFVSSATVFRFGQVKLTTGQRKEIGKFGPFTLTAACTINDAGNDRAQLLISTSQDHSALDASADDADFNIADGEQNFANDTVATGTPTFNAESDGSAVAPDGTQINAVTYSGVNVLNAPGQCVLGGVLIVG